MGDLVGRDAEITELPAVFVAINGVQADGVGGLVHELAVTGGHHVSAQGWVDGGAVLLVTEVAAVVVAVTAPRGVNAAAVGALPLCGGVTGAGELIRGVSAVVVTVALPPGVDAFAAVGALELGDGACSGAVPLVPVVTTIVIAVTHPLGLNTQVVVALHLSGWALHLVTVNLVSEITTVVVPVTLVFLGDALAVLAQQLVGATTVGGAVQLIRSIGAIFLCVAHPVILDA